MTLENMKGKCAVIAFVRGERRDYLYSLGFRPGERVEILAASASAIAVSVVGVRYALGREICAAIVVRDEL